MKVEFVLIETQKPIRDKSIVRRKSDDKLAIVNPLTINDPKHSEHTHVNLFLKFENSLIATNDKDSTLLKINDFIIKEFIDNYNNGKKNNYGYAYVDDEKNTEINVVLYSLSSNKNEKKYTFDEMKYYFSQVMNLGMTHRQNQLSGHSDKSGNEILENWINENWKKNG